MAKCPVCNFHDPGMSSPPEAYYICPCCGTEFFLDDEFKSHAELRLEWMARGMPWFSNFTARPDGWDPWKQLGIHTVQNTATSAVTVSVSAYSFGVSPRMNAQTSRLS